MTSKIRSMARLTGLILVLLLCAGDAWAQRDRRGSFRTQQYELGPRELQETLAYAPQFGFTVNIRRMFGRGIECRVLPRPRDGVLHFSVRSTVPIARTMGQGACFFDLFGGRELRSGWRLVEWDVRPVPVGAADYALNDNVIVDIRPGDEGDRRIHTRFQVMDTNSIAFATTMVLEGPAGADWKDAFRRDADDQPTRQYHLTGGEIFPALHFATSQGFENVGARRTRATNCQITPSGLRVYPTGRGTDGMSCRFTILHGRRLAEGWTLERVVLRPEDAAYDWEERPRLGTDDPSFAVNVRTGGDAGEVEIERIVLKGPRGQSWQDAFRP